MKVSKEQAISVLVDYGFTTATTWIDKNKINVKLLKLIQMAVMGEYEAKDEAVRSLVERIMIDDSDIEIVDELVEEDKEEIRLKEAAKRCPLQGKECVVVTGGEDTYKAIVKYALTVDRCLVRDKDGKEWEVSVEDCKVVVGKKGKIKKGTKKKSDDSEIKALEKQIAILEKNSKDDSGKSKKIKRGREEIAVGCIRKSGEGGIEVEEVVMIVEKRYVKQGMAANIVASDAVVKRIVKYGVMFGVVKEEGRMLRWIGGE